MLVHDRSFCNGLGLCFIFGECLEPFTESTTICIRTSKLRNLLNAQMYITLQKMNYRVLLFKKCLHLNLDGYAELKKHLVSKIVRSTHTLNGYNLQRYIYMCNIMCFSIPFLFLHLD